MPKHNEYFQPIVDRFDLETLRTLEAFYGDKPKGRHARIRTIPFYAVKYALGFESKHRPINFRGLRGKHAPSRIRPIVGLDLYRAISGSPFNDAQTDNAYAFLPMAIGCEFGHTASLIYDDSDSMDASDMRRGRESVPKKFGPDIALLAAITLQNDSWRCFNAGMAQFLKRHEYERPDMFVAAATETIGETIEQVTDGQLQDIARQKKILRVHSSEEAYRIAEAKTRLFVIMTKLIGIVVDQAGLVEPCTEMGYKLSRAYQLADDLKDSELASEDVGKPTGADQNNTVSIAGPDNVRQELHTNLDRVIELISDVRRQGEDTSQLEALLNNKLRV